MVWIIISKNKREKNHVKRNSGSSWCIVCLYYSFYKIVNLCNSIIGDIVEFLTVYTFKFIYVMFVLSITIWISKKHVDFCNKDAIWNGSQLEKKEKRWKLQISKNLQNLWTIPEIITITKRAVILACSGKKENVCVCLLEWEWMSDGYDCVFYVEFMYMGECHSIWIWVPKSLCIKCSVE